MFNLFAKKKVGLVLGSGAARGLAHVGAVKALQEQRIPVDCIAGASIGALVGACYARNGDITEFEHVVLKTDFKRFLGLVDVNLALMSKGLVQGNKVKELLKPLIGDVTFKDLQIPLAVVATDVYTGEEVILREGSVLEAVRASISMPVIFTPVKIGKKFLIDGGVVDPLPVKVARSMGAGRVIACNVVHDPGKMMEGRRRESTAEKEAPPVCREPDCSDRVSAFQAQMDKCVQEGNVNLCRIKNFIGELTRHAEPKPGKVKDDTPDVFNVLMQVIYVAAYKLIQPQIKEADFVVTPDAAHIELLAFYRGKELIQLGYAAMKQMLPQIGRRVPVT